MRYSSTGTFLFSRGIAPTNKIEMTGPFRFVNPNLLSKRIGKHSIIGNEQIDAIASRIFGPGRERLFYRVLAANAAKILAYKGDSEKIGSVVIPPPDIYP
jgi:hypothetical protein